MRISSWLRQVWSRLAATFRLSSRTASDTGFAYKCAVCGTDVAASTESCPLCRSNDIIPQNRSPPSQAEETRSAPEFASREHVVDRNDDAVEQLRAVRADSDLLARHQERWQPVEAGFRVETPTGAQVVASRDEVIAVLRTHYG